MNKETIPENILRLLRSLVHEDRLIGLTLLLLIPDYRKFFETDCASYHYVVLNIEEDADSPTTLIKTETNTFWVDRKNLYVHSSEFTCNWGGADREFKI